MKVVLVVLLILHGLIHLLGFLKGFQLAKVEQLQLPISKMTGLFWLLVALLFAVTLIGLILKKEFWTYFALIAILFSQVLIILHWQDAKIGTVANVIILLLILPFFGKQQFEKQITREKTALINSFQIEIRDTLKQEDIVFLPPVVQKWLNQTGVIGKPKAFSVRLQQSGQLKTKPESGWMPFEAHQYIDLNRPAFIWTTEVSAFAGITLAGRDRLENGRGEMLIKLFGLIPVVDEKDNLQINTGAMIRFLAEICWYPSAAVNEYIVWESAGQHSAKATLTLNNLSVNGVFSFSENGELSSFEALRYFGGSKEAQKYPWRIEASQYRVFEGVNIPEDSRVIWKLPEGDFEWLRLKITAVNYNTTAKIM